MDRKSIAKLAARSHVSPWWVGPKELDAYTE
jgi:hypothetical protein